MRKLVIVVCLLMFITASSVYAINFNPSKYSRGKIETEEYVTAEPYEKVECPRDEWNSMFEDFREGLIDKEDMKAYVRSCKYPY